jgi:hypothetical protein
MEILSVGGFIGYLFNTVRRTYKRMYNISKCAFFRLTVRDKFYFCAFSRTWLIDACL